MVSGTQIVKVTKVIFLRSLLLIGTIVLSFLTGNFFQNFNENIFQYINPPGFFAMASLAESLLALDLALVFWSGIILGASGKKSDYILIVLIILYALWGYSGTTNVTSQMYLGLIGAAILGNAIGYGLKLARLKWLHS